MVAGRLYLADMLGDSHSVPMSRVVLAIVRVDMALVHTQSSGLLGEPWPRTLVGHIQRSVQPSVIV